jgi:hypothetical protein
MDRTTGRKVANPPLDGDRGRGVARPARRGIRRPAGGDPRRRVGARSLVLMPMVALALVGAACSGTATTGTTRTSGTGGPGPTATSGTTPATGASTTVPAGTVASALTTALDTEHQAKATYDNVVAALGDRGPFANVSAGEAKHIATLEYLAQKYSVPLPTGPFTGQPSPATLTAACRLGVTVEQAVIATYDRLLPQVASVPSLVQAFGNLRSTSQTDHLPAFQHCA